MNFFAQIQAITREHCREKGYPVPAPHPEDAAEVDAIERTNAAIKKAADAARGAGLLEAKRPEVYEPLASGEGCYKCGTSDLPLDECVGCRAQRRMEARADRDRGA